MTWRTEIGERTLQGAEAKLVREAIGMMSDLIWDEVRTAQDLWSFGVKVFDQLEPPARLAMLLEVGTGLLRETPACPPLTAITEGTVAAIFGHVRQSIAVEMDEGETHWRGDVLAAFHETSPEWEDLPEPDCDDPEQWRGLLESLEERILWDLDFEDGDQFLDMPPAVAAAKRERFGISDDYFAAIAPDPSLEQCTAIREALVRLCRVG